VNIKRNYKAKILKTLQPVNFSKAEIYKST